MNRIESVDSVRLLAIISIIVIHTEPFFYQTYDSKLYFHLEIVINQFARFAVPFFFVISGYFWGLKIRSGKELLATTNKMGFRIISLFLVWSLIYLLPYNLSLIHEIGILGAIEASYLNLLALLREPSVMLLQGTKVHLWFLVGLLFALYISFIFINRNAEKELLLFSIFLYVVGVLLKSYADSPVGYSVDFNTRNGPFFSTLLFSSGYFISRYRPKPSWFIYGLVAFVFGFLLHFTEIYMLNKFYGTSMVQDYVFGTYLMGLGTAVLSLSNHSLLRVNALSRFGQMVLGIYAVHIIFVEIGQPIDMILDSIWWELGYILLVLMLSIVSVVWMSKVPFLRRAVS